MGDEKAVELYRKYRPKNFKDLVGQDGAVKKLTALGKEGKLPHALLFTGPSGCGKTTLARILRKKLKCSDHDFCELNIGDFKGVDTVRNIREKMNLAPMNGDCRVYLLDECHQLTSQAQDALLKMLEDTPEHVYFFLCTTNPTKLANTIKTRCEEISVKPLKREDVLKLVNRIAKDEGLSLSEPVVEKINEFCEGSARKALVLLHSIIGTEGEDAQLEALSASTSEVQSIELARALLNPTANFATCLKVLRELDADPEEVRCIVLTYAKKVMLNPKSVKILPRAYLVINAFRDNFYDSKHAGLIAACYEVFHG